MKQPIRCGWCTSQPLYVEYHDSEWGVPEKDPLALFELLNLEGMQAGLSWWTVLSKREHMRKQFFGFDPNKLSNATESDVEGWLGDAGLIRHGGKLRAMISNARCYLECEDFTDLIWQSVDGKPVINQIGAMADVPAKTTAAEQLAKRLKKLGFRFVGPTTVYAFMQSAGLVNDHVLECEWHQKCARIAKDFHL